MKSTQATNSEEGSRQRRTCGEGIRNKRIGAQSSEGEETAEEKKKWRKGHIENIIKASTCTERSETLIGTLIGRRTRKGKEVKRKIGQESNPFGLLTENTTWAIPQTYHNHV